MLVVVLKEGQTATKEEILGFLQGKIAKWWMPDDVVFVEELPHTATGKIQKLRCAINSRTTGCRTCRRRIKPSAYQEIKMRTLPRAGALAASALIAGLSALVAAGPFTPAAAQTAGKTMTTASGLKITNSKVGTGASPKRGQTCVMHYTGWLYVNGIKGKKFELFR